jgi:hypothetical protein
MINNLRRSSFLPSCFVLSSSKKWSDLSRRHILWLTIQHDINMASYEQALMRATARAARRRLTRSAPITTAPSASLQPHTSCRTFSSTPSNAASGFNAMGFSGGAGQSSGSAISNSYFTRQGQSLPANTIVRFVPQQTAWVVERMGKFQRVLEPGLAVLLPFLDRIAYVKSLKEVAIEIPSQSAITADNVTLDLDGVLYTRVFDPYKARYVLT